MKVLYQFITVTVMTMLCIGTLNQKMVAGTIELPNPLMEKMGNEKRNENSGNFDQGQSLTFDISEILINPTFDTSLFQEGVLFVERPRIFVSTPDGRVFSKSLNDDFVVVNDDATQSVQIVINNPPFGLYKVGIDIPQSTIPIPSGGSITIQGSSGSFTRGPLIPTVFASRDKSLTNLNDITTIQVPNEQTQGPIVPSFFAYGPPCSKVP